MIYLSYLSIIHWALWAGAHAHLVPKQGEETHFKVSIYTNRLPYWQRLFTLVLPTNVRLI